ncbi:MAG: metallophosphoesterase [Bacteroidales bacterium]|nr:metallophosphoesterase [Bacteroidales bacterium]
MKKWVVISIILVVIVVLYFFIDHFYPKSSGRYPVLLFLTALDLYLYFKFKQGFRKKHPIAFFFLKPIFWLPLILIGIVLILTPVAPLYLWPKLLRIYTPAIALVGFSVKISMAIFIGMADLLWVFQKRKKPGHSENNTTYCITKKNLYRAGLFSGLMVLIALIAGMTYGIYHFKVHEITLQVKNLPDDLDGFRIVQVSDLHLGSWISPSRLEEAVEIINGLNPDIFIFTGDLVNYSSDETCGFVDILKGIEAKYGKFSITGNHDYGHYRSWPSKEARQSDVDRLFDYHKKAGWTLLLNSNKTITINNSKIAILGVENWGELERFPKYAKLEKAFKGTHKADTRILLSHDPSHWIQKVIPFEGDILVTFAGHTHGFQVGAEFWGIKFSPAKYLYKYWGGLYEQDNEVTGKTQYLYVNRGLGSLGYPGRLGIWPEITLLTLHTKEH